ncbi:MAG: LysR family transcriptional regulator [Acidobacteriota bacterium]
MDFRLRQLQCFMVLSDTLNYGKAARALYLTQPTLTFQIKSLEVAVGAKLFDRNRQRVSLTDAGFAFRDYAANILATAHAAREHLDGLACRLSLRVCCGPVGTYVVLPTLIRSLARIYPDFQMEIQEMTTEQQITELPETRVDALLMIPELPIPGARFEPIWSEPLVAIVSRQNPLAQNRSVSMRDLEESGIIASRLRDCRFHQPFIRSLFAPFGIEPRIVEAPQSCSVQLAYAAAGEGVLLAPRSVANCAFPNIVPLPIEEELPHMHLGLTSMRTNNTIAMKIFRQVALQCTKEMAASLSQEATEGFRCAVVVMPPQREAV